MSAPSKSSPLNSSASPSSTLPPQAFPAGAPSMSAPSNVFPLNSSASSSSLPPQAPEGERRESKRRKSSSPTLSRRAVVSDWNGKVSRTISIDRLPEEGKRLNQPPRLARNASVDSVDRRVIHQLLRPREWAAHTGERQFALTAKDVVELCDLVQPILEAEPTLLQLSAPIKVFGDLHGQYTDLMRIFEMYGVPKKEGGDIGIIDYLFLGDYVDRGKHSLETIVLLLALKVAHPRAVFLVRGNHESPEVNARDGFLHECAHRLDGKQQGLAVWRRLNLLFEWMPMAATINGCILCVHGGIGRTLRTLDEICAMQRPLRVGGANAELMLDLLWSDPTKSDEVEGVHLNGERGAPVVCFGPDRVCEFLQTNRLKLIVRGHECVMDGFQRFAGGKLITLFSATNYCNRWRNAGAILFIAKDLEITPKIIFPVEEIEDAWLRHEEVDHMRPPTPPREQAGSSPPPKEESDKAGRCSRGDGGGAGGESCGGADGSGCGEGDGEGGKGHDGQPGGAGEGGGAGGDAVDVASGGRRTRSSSKRGTAAVDAGGRTTSPTRRLSLETITEEDRDASGSVGGDAAAGGGAPAIGATGGGRVDHAVDEETEDDG